MDGVLLQQESVGFGVPEGFKGELAQGPGGDDGELLGVECLNLLGNGADQVVG